MSFLKKCLSWGLDLLIPPHCAICETPLLEDEPSEIFCNECRQDILPQNGQFCCNCGSYFLVPTSLSLFAGSPPKEQCSACSSNNNVFSHLLTLGEYDGKLRDIVLQMKQQRDGFLGRVCTTFLFKQQGERFQRIGADLILPVPMHYTRRFLRGVNSPEFIAQTLSELLHIPYHTRVLQRQYATAPQFELNPDQRRLNVQNVFRLQPRIFAGCLLKKTTTFLAGKKILLVDDILTTGSTCNEIAQLLLHNGVSSVAVAVLARTRGVGLHEKDKVLREDKWKR
ncbi:MAG: ComF family protein [Thermoguttaceae bacterium]